MLREINDRSAGLQRLRTDGTRSKGIFLGGLALALCLFGASPEAPQEIRDNEGFLVGVLLKNLALKERMASDIPASDRELQTSERIFLEAERASDRLAAGGATWSGKGPCWPTLPAASQASTPRR